MEALIVLGAITLLGIDIAIAVFFRDIARMKGHKEKRYFWMTLFFGPVGWAMVIALPDRGDPEEAAKRAAVDELPDI